MQDSPDDTPRPKQPKRIHPTQVRLAFEPGHGAYPGRLLLAADGSAFVERIADHARIELVVERPDRLAAILERGDLTRLGDAPLVLVSESYRLLAVGTGPAEPPDQIRCLAGICRLEDGDAVEIPPAADDQPSWQLIGAQLRSRSTEPSDGED